MWRDCTHARARSIVEGAEGVPRVVGVTARWVTYSAIVSAEAGNGVRPLLAHQVVKVS
ncbi:hypothetical protein [Streptosporangium sp. NPDC023615]|uniref:hypothetical protein n=1 Tax=Streptosporangium sp. NPDC023615 TaxID=3154794 RepID=UPI0034222D5C